MEEGAGPVLALRVTGGRGGGASPEDVAARAEELARGHGAIRLLILVEGLGFLEAASLRSHLPLATRLAARVERVAVVGDQGWLKAALRSAPGGGAEIRHFPSARVGEARDWINALPGNEMGAGT